MASLADTPRPYLVHLRYSGSSPVLPPVDYWLDPPEKLHFGDGSIEIVGLTNDLSGLVDFLHRDDVDADVIGPLKLKRRLNNQMGAQKKSADVLLNTSWRLS